MDIQLWYTFKDVLDYTIIPGHGIKEVLKLLCNRCWYQDKRLIHTYICHVDPRKVILLKSTATYTILVNGIYVYDLNYECAWFKSNER